MSGSETDGGPEDIRAQLHDLRSRLDRLIAERVRPAVSEAEARAGAAMRHAGETAREGVEPLAAEIRQRPISAVLIAVALGYVIGRISR